MIGEISGGAAVLAAMILLGAALGVGSYVLTSEESDAIAPKVITARPPTTASTRLFRREPLTNADLPPTKPARGAFDFVGPESDGPSLPRLSTAVRAEDWQAIEAAWRAGDFAGAAGRAAALLDLDDRRSILLPLLADWTAANPPEAARFAQARPAGVERKEMLETTIRAWSQQNVAAASAWLDALEPEPDHDGAVAAVATCEVLLQRRPKIALSWAESIGAPTLRWEAICTIAQDWARRDAAAARSYVETCGVLTPAERAQMLAHLRRWAVAVR